ncbi:MAG TPA: hypothetical protein VFV67_08200 [Actinophytocola sp.]|uniref:hypothetical protein n=1 Tax=Actinophytocola sp. TaxID=1872138 RepID=UPI002DBB0DDE|nr:hypothetical protein [Actinophytocola sp.]HEU5470620.1 hypothetical protein [Actinophytocola sp.]
MTAHAAQDPVETSRSVCWCCGAERGDDELVHLGDHPEVGICPSCARWVHRRGTQIEDAHRPSIAAWWRARIHAARTAVINRGWHQRGVLGALLRRIDRHLP